MKNIVQNNGASEGYIYSSFGADKYLKDAVVSALTIRRYDEKRPIALFCSKEHFDKKDIWNLYSVFDVIEILDPKHQSIVGFKHNLHHYMPFDRNMYLDSDMIWCRNPKNLWHQFLPFGYTVTGQESADIFYGAPKGVRISRDVLLRRRQRTLKRFNLTHLYRVQTGMMYAANRELTENVNRRAQYYLNQKDKTHFISRKNERDRNLESCEWSLGMAMSEMKLYVVPWFNGYESPQLDFIEGQVRYNDDFTEVSCLYYCNPFMHSLRGLNSQMLRNIIIKAFSILPRSQDKMWITPYVLHFGWSHQKEHFKKFRENQWKVYMEKQSIEQ